MLSWKRLAAPALLPRQADAASRAAHAKLGGVSDGNGGSGRQEVLTGSPRGWKACAVMISKREPLLRPSLAATCLVVASDVRAPRWGSYFQGRAACHNVLEETIRERHSAVAAATAAAAGAAAAAAAAAVTFWSARACPHTGDWSRLHVSPSAHGSYFIRPTITQQSWSLKSFNKCTGDSLHLRSIL